MLIKLMKPVSAELALPLCTESYANHTIALAGMGWTNYSTKQPARVLQELRFDERLEEDCPLTSKITSPCLCRWLS